MNAHDMDDGVDEATMSRNYEAFVEYKNTGIMPTRAIDFWGREVEVDWSEVFGRFRRYRLYALTDTAIVIEDYKFQHDYTLGFGFEPEPIPVVNTYDFIRFGNITNRQKEIKYNQALKEALYVASRDYHNPGQEFWDSTLSPHWVTWHYNLLPDSDCPPLFMGNCIGCGRAGPIDNRCPACIGRVDEDPWCQRPKPGQRVRFKGWNHRVLNPMWLSRLLGMPVPEDESSSQVEGDDGGFHGGFLDVTIQDSDDLEKYVPCNGAENRGLNSVRKFLIRRVCNVHLRVHPVDPRLLNHRPGFERVERSPRRSLLVAPRTVVDVEGPREAGNERENDIREAQGIQGGGPDENL
jgi:hypothetical protein